MRLVAATILAAIAAVMATALPSAQGYDKKTTEKMLGDGARKLASANPADRELGIGFMYGYLTCAYRQQYMPAVVKALKDPSPKVRTVALQTLEKVQATTAIPDIVLLLDDPVDDVRERAAYALGAIGDKSAEPGLTKARETARAQNKNTLALTMQEGLDEISGKSPVDHPTCP